jgi:hypothetical protein
MHKPMLEKENKAEETQKKATEIKMCGNAQRVLSRQ